MIKKIRQKHRSGCSVASLAMLLGISYQQALWTLHPNHQPYETVCGDMWTIKDALVRAKAKLIFHSNLGKLHKIDDEEVDIRSFKKPAILGIYQRDISGANHAVVWDPDTQKVLDPGRKRNLPVNYYQRRLVFAFELA